MHSSSRIDPMHAAIEARHVCKTFGAGHRALDDVCMEVAHGEVLVVMGPSGSGKSTLIRTFNGLESIDSGELRVLDIGLDREAEPRRIQRIRKRVGMVFQQFNLFPHLSILDNITLAPVRVQHQKRELAEERALQLLEQMGIAEQANKYPAQLSGGQQQRVAIVRAIASRPAVTLADEPTANLDSHTAEQLLDIMQQLNEEQQVTFVFSTHDPRVMARARRTVRLVDGRVEEDGHAAS